MPLFSAVLLDAADDFARKCLSAPMMVLIGRLSYSIYLFHLLARTPAEVAFGSPYRLESAVIGLFITGTLSVYSVCFCGVATRKYSPSAQEEMKVQPFSEGDRSRVLIRRYPPRLTLEGRALGASLQGWLILQFLSDLIFSTVSNVFERA